MQSDNVCKFAFVLQAILSFLLTTQCAPQTSSAPTMRIIGGSATTISEVPYLVNIRKSGKFICGGTLVTYQHVVTAAHCVHGSSSSSLIVTGGATFLTDVGVKRGVKAIYTSSSYRKNSLHSDIAVLKLSQEMRGSNIATVGLCDSNWTVGEVIRVSGWGQTTETKSSASNRVLSVMVPLVAHSACVRQYKNVAPITNTMFCATEAGVKDACSGDSGGPAIYKGQLCGVVSWGVGCARRRFPGVYTNVKKVKSFIQKALLK